MNWIGTALLKAPHAVHAHHRIDAFVMAPMAELIDEHILMIVNAFVAWIRSKVAKEANFQFPHG